MLTSFELEDLEVPDELKVWVRSQVVSGRYPTETDVIVAALELLLETPSEMDQPRTSSTPETQGNHPGI
jgi:Arc/MetJ-type ribon-helix-helix transcriptional regulator